MGYCVHRGYIGQGGYGNADPELEYMSFTVKNESAGRIRLPVAVIGPRRVSLNGAGPGVRKMLAFLEPVVADEIAIEYQTEVSDEVVVRSFPYRERVAGKRIRHLEIEFVFVGENVECNFYRIGRDGNSSVIE